MPAVFLGLKGIDTPSEFMVQAGVLQGDCPQIGNHLEKGNFFVTEAVGLRRIDAQDADDLSPAWLGTVRRNQRNRLYGPNPFLQCLMRVLVARIVLSR